MDAEKSDGPGRPLTDSFGRSQGRGTTNLTKDIC
ncbi:MAG: hypothetical protein ACI80F_002178, partial [Natronomonas sp.]